MRGRFLAELAELAAEDERILFLTGDLGFMVVEPFAERHPGRFFNLGVAEQNMVGVATGLAEGGFLPFVYSIATFATLRPFEFIRNGPAAHRLPVRLVGVGGGFEYGSAGPTHHAVEDVGAMRLLPGMTIVAPADAGQAVNALRATWNLPGPVYFRLGKNDTASVPGLEGSFELGRPNLLRPGRGVALVSMGPLAFEALSAATELERAGADPRVLALATLAPVDAPCLAASLEGVDLAVAIEAHNVVGGLGSLLCEVVAEAGLPCRVLRLGVRGGSELPGGSDAYLLRHHGLTATAIFTTVLDELGRRS